MRNTTKHAILDAFDGKVSMGRCVNITMYAAETSHRHVPKAKVHHILNYYSAMLTHRKEKKNLFLCFMSLPVVAATVNERNPTQLRSSASERKPTVCCCLISPPPLPSLCLADSALHAPSTSTSTSLAHTLV